MSVRIQYYDNLRAFACFLVILTHSAMPALDSSFGIFMIVISLFSSPSSELFVSISSSLLAPTDLSMKEFYKKRFKKLLWPFLFWSLFMVGFQYFSGQINIDTALERTLLVAIKPTSGVYWFIYAICALYFINPIISPWLRTATKNELRTIIGFWSLTLLLPIINILTGKDLYIINGDYNFPLVYFGGFIGYMIIGVYFKKFPILIENKVNALLIVLILMLLGLVPFVIGYLLNVPTKHLIGNNLSLTSAFFVIAFYLFFKNFKLPSAIETGATIIAKYSFGIYLIHILVVREVVWKVMENIRIPHPLIETPLIASVSLLICLLIVKGLSYLPKSEYFIGA